MKFEVVSHKIADVDNSTKIVKFEIASTKFFFFKKIFEAIFKQEYSVFELNRPTLILKNEYTLEKFLDVFDMRKLNRICETYLMEEKIKEKLKEKNV